MNNREVKTIKIILRTRSKYEEMKNIKSCNSKFIIMITAIAGNMQPLTQSSQWIIMITFRDK